MHNDFVRPLRNRRDRSLRFAIGVRLRFSALIPFIEPLLSIIDIMGKEKVKTIKILERFAEVKTTRTLREREEIRGRDLSSTSNLTSRKRK